jgi:glycosyltransferase involved in cell wall biosynthesis
MKIIHLISGGDTGGAKTHVLALLSNLKKNNVDVELLCIMEGIFTEEARDLGIKVTVIRQEKRYDVSVIAKIRDFINNSGCDLVHCHGARANYIALFIMHSIKVPMITTLHSDYKLDFAGNFRKNLVYTPINAFALRRFKHILTVTQAFKNMLVQRGFKKDRLHIIYNGIDFNFKSEFYDKAEFFSRLGLEYDTKSKYVGIAARLFAVKGVNVFLEMANIAAKKSENIKFLVVGDGELMDEYKKYVADNALENRVFLAGQITDEKMMNSFYNAIDINMLTSYSESFPYALLEGARMKKATVATAVGGIPEMIENGKTGLLAQSGNAEQLADNVLKLCNDENLLESLANNFYNKAKADFSVEKMAQTHKEIYTKIIKENKK